MKFAGGPPPKHPYSYEPTPHAKLKAQQQAAKVTTGNAQVDDQVEQALLELNDLKSEAINSTGPNAPDQNDKWNGNLNWSNLCVSSQMYFVLDTFTKIHCGALDILHTNGSRIVIYH